MTSLYLVRHGETDWNAQRRIQGSTDIPLNETGREQAAATGRLLSRRGWSGIYASPLSRAMNTASIIASEVGLAGPTPIAGLVERNYGAAEGLNAAQIDALFPKGAEVPGRESHEEVAARVLPALLELATAHPGESLIIVSHGGVIRTILNSLEGVGSHGTITNGSVHSFEVREGSLELIQFDDPIDELSLACATDDLEQQNALERRDSLQSPR